MRTVNSDKVIGCDNNNNNNKSSIILLFSYKNKQQQQDRDSYNYLWILSYFNIMRKKNDYLFIFK